MVWICGELKSIADSLNIWESGSQKIDARTHVRRVPEYSGNLQST